MKTTGCSWYLTPFAVIFAFSALVNAQTGSGFPSKIDVPVTYYDFHSNGSCPEFNMNSWWDRVYNMVDSTLDSERKPVLGDSATFVKTNTVSATNNTHPWPYYNNFIYKWFREWQPGDDRISKWTTTGYASANATGESYGKFDGVVETDYDTAYKNIMFDDVLTFNLIDPVNGVYQYKSSSFFPLDGKGFRNEPSIAETPARVMTDHNYSFTMELHASFTKRTGSDLYFEFEGDDDVWAFVNNKLVLDIGGRHGPIADDFRVNDIPGLENDVKYNFDFFFAERHAAGSTILITTNILTPQLFLDVENTTIHAGESTEIHAIVKDEDGVERPDLAEYVEWELVPPILEGDVLSEDNGEETEITATKAFRTIVVQANWTDPEGEVGTLTATAEITILPGPPAQIEIRDYSYEPAEEADFMPVDYDDSTTVKPYEDTVKISRNQDSVYIQAITRDKYGNITGLADAAAWETSIPSNISISARSGRKWEAGAKRILPDEKKGIVTVSQSSLTSDEAPIVISNADIRGPELDSAKFYLGDPLRTGNGNRDTLIVWFSEPVTCETLEAYIDNPDGAFKYIGHETEDSAWEDSKLWSETLNSCQDTIDSVVIILETQSIIYPLIDSLQIEPGSLKDTYGNTGPADGDTVVIRWGRPYPPDSKKAPNPFNPDVDKIPEVIKDRIDLNDPEKNETVSQKAPPTYGTTIQIRRPNSDIDVNATKMDIYDAVGNIVRKDLPVFRSKNRNEGLYFFFWDGHNENNRTVGAGTYLAVIYMHWDGEPVSIERVKIGLKR